MAGWLAAVVLVPGVAVLGGPAWAEVEPPEPTVVDAPDTVSIAEARELSPAVRTAAQTAASSVGASSAVLVEGTMPMLSVMRGTVTVQRAARNYRIPMTFSALDAGPATAIYGDDIGTALTNGELVMSELSATLRGAQVGDVVELKGWNRKVLKFTLGAISSRAPSELVMSTAMALALGAKRQVRVVVWGFGDRDAMEAALGSNGLLSSTIRVYRSWEPRFADDLLSQSQVKALAGEFSVRGSGNLTVNYSWAKPNIVRIPLQLGTRTIYARCHQVIADELTAIFAEITAQGLDTTINYRGRNITAGCYAPRETRLLGSTNGGSISRHTWAIAMDFNVVSNCLGCVPTQDCKLVQIFRAHGFAWGGNFLTPDGMHFEYVGEPRDEVPTRPGAYCPTDPPPPPTTTTTTTTIEATTTEEVTTVP